MFLRLRLRLLSRRIERVGRRQGNCQTLHAELSELSRQLTYQRRFFQNKLEEAVYATTLREWLRAIFRRPKYGWSARWTGGEKPPTPPSCGCDGVDDLKDK